MINERLLYHHFVRTSEPEKFRVMIDLVTHPDELRNIAISILENPNSSEQEIQSARVFTKVYKDLVNEDCNHIPGLTEERAICVDDKGREVGIRAR